MVKFSDCSYFLAKNPDAQEELFREIEEAVLSNGGDQHLDYNIIQSLPYLDQVKLNQNFTYFKHLKNYIFKLCYSNSDYISQVVHEALRMYPLAIIERLCVKDYKIPGINFVVPKGMMVQVAK